MTQGRGQGDAAGTGCRVGGRPAGEQGCAPVVPEARGVPRGAGSDVSPSRPRVRPDVLRGQRLVPGRALEGPCVLGQQPHFWLLCGLQGRGLWGMEHRERGAHRQPLPKGEAVPASWATGRQSHGRLPRGCPALCPWAARADPVSSTLAPGITRTDTRAHTASTCGPGQRVHPRSSGVSMCVRHLRLALRGGCHVPAPSPAALTQGLTPAGMRSMACRRQWGAPHMPRTRRSLWATDPTTPERLPLGERSAAGIQFSLRERRALVCGPRSPDLRACEADMLWRVQGTGRLACRPRVKPLSPVESGPV